jgi:hypothetical protein
VLSFLLRSWLPLFHWSFYLNALLDHWSFLKVDFGILSLAFQSFLYFWIWLMSSYFHLDTSGSCL